MIGLEKYKEPIGYCVKTTIEKLFIRGFFCTSKQIYKKNNNNTNNTPEGFFWTCSLWLVNKYYFYLTCSFEKKNQSIYYCLFYGVISKYQKSIKIGSIANVGWYNGLIEKWGK